MRCFKKRIIRWSSVLYLFLTMQSFADIPYIPVSTDTQAAISDSIADYIVVILQNDVTPIIVVVATLFCLYKSITGIFGGYASYQKDKDSAAFKESLIMGFIFIALSGALIYYMALKFGLDLTGGGG